MRRHRICRRVIVLGNDSESAAPMAQWIPSQRLARGESQYPASGLCPVEVSRKGFVLLVGPQGRLYPITMLGRNRTENLPEPSSDPDLLRTYYSGWASRVCGRPFKPFWNNPPFSFVFDGICDRTRISRFSR